MIDDAAECPIDFNTFVLSLSSNVLAQLGQNGKSDPPKPAPVQLALAKQTIDILELLETKTAGNLTGEEERLLNSVLAEVRAAYVAHAGDS